jgi:hypothetical protein
MSQEQVDPTISMMHDLTQYMEALHSIIETSSDAETVRIALAAMTSTESGRNFFAHNPIIL